MHAQATRAQKQKSWHCWMWAIVGSVAIFAGATLLSPHCPFFWLFSYIVAFVAVVTEVLIVSVVTPKPSRFMIGLSAIPICLLFLIHSQNRFGLIPAMGVTGSLLIIGSLWGSAVGFAIKHVGHIFFVVVVSSIADIFSVFHPWGPTATIAQSEQTLSVLALPWPMLGTAQIEPLMGLGEVVFSSIYLAASRAHRLNTGKTLWALGSGFVATMVLVMLTLRPIPVLPFLGIAILFAHGSTRIPPIQDRRQGWLVLAVIIILILVLIAYRLVSP